MALASSLREGIRIPWIRVRRATVVPAHGHDPGPGKRPGILTHAGGNRNFAHRPPARAGALLLLLAVLGAAPGGGAGFARAAPPLVLLVQPPQWPADAAWFEPQPLAALMARALGRAVEPRVSDDVLGHWQAVRAPPDYQLAFDEAHFADFRIRRHGFRVVARDAAQVRFAVLVRPRTVLAAPSDLAARAVAVPPPPSLATLRLMTLFPDPARVPRLVVVPSRAAALDALAGGEVLAALAAADADPRAAQQALLTDVSPGRAISVDAALPEAARVALVRALTAAAASASGRRALAAVGVGAFEPASDGAYEDSARLLRGTWGYR